MEKIKREKALELAKRGRIVNIKTSKYITYIHVQEHTLTENMYKYTHTVIIKDNVVGNTRKETIFEYKAMVIDE